MVLSYLVRLVLLYCAPARIGVAAVVQADGVRLELDRRVVVGDGALLLAVVEIGEPAVVQRRGVGRIELDRLVVVGDGLVVVGGGRIGDAAVVVGRRLLRIGLDRLVVVGDGLGDIALGLPFDAAVGIRQRQRLAVVGAGLDRARAGRDRVVARAPWRRFPNRRRMRVRRMRWRSAARQKAEVRQALIGIMSPLASPPLTNQAAVRVPRRFRR